MRDSNPKALSALGFLTVLDLQPQGLLGGYLILNAAARPLEFHCTAPVRPNRAQQILYGPTLEPFLFGEQIGGTLVGKSKITPQVLLTDRHQMLAVRALKAVPIAVVLAEPARPAAEAAESRSRLPGGTLGEFTDSVSTAVEVPSGGRDLPIQPPHLRGAPPLLTFTAAGHSLAVDSSQAQDIRRITEWLVQLDDSFDVAEPFERIRAAIEEAQRGTAASPRDSQAA